MLGMKPGSMIRLPDRAVVLGSGGGALTIAAELSLAGVEVTWPTNPVFPPVSKPSLPPEGFG